MPRTRYYILSRTSLRILKTVSQLQAALLWKEPNEACARRADRLMKLLLPKDKGGVFLQTRFPPAALEALYSEQLFRDKKGNVQSSSIFQGAPYRYGTPEATHVWFPISSSLRGGLGKADVVVRKKQPMCRAPPIDTSAASLEASADADNLPTSTVPATPCTPFANFSLSTPKVDSVSDGFAPESTVKAAADLMELATEPSETKADDDIFGQQTATKAKRKLSKKERQALERRRRAKLLAGTTARISTRMHARVCVHVCTRAQARSSAATTKMRLLWCVRLLKATSACWPGNAGPLRSCSQRTRFFTSVEKTPAIGSTRTHESHRSNSALNITAVFILFVCEREGREGGFLAAKCDATSAPDSGVWLYPLRTVNFFVDSQYAVCRHKGPGNI